MRIYKDCYELMSELLREVWEMGLIVHPKSMQNKDVSGDENFQTKEIINYSYCLKARDKEDVLFWSDPRSIAWVHAEFKERTGKEPVNPGDAWRIRYELWHNFLTEQATFDYTYSERMSAFGALNKIKDEAIRNPDSRQLILSIWSPEDIKYIGGNKRVPCSVYYQFLIRDGKLHIVYNQRSADIVTHFGDDVWLAWELMKYMALETGNKPGWLYHNIGSLHSYKKDWDILKGGLTTLIQ